MAAMKSRAILRSEKTTAGRLRARKDFNVIDIHASQMLHANRIRNLILAGSLALAAVTLSACYPAAEAPLGTAQPVASAQTSVPAPTAVAAATSTVAPTTALEVGSTPVPTGASMIAPTRTPTSATPVPPTAVPATKQGGVAGANFAYPMSLAKGTEGSTVPEAAGGSDAPWWVPVPEHREIRLTGYVLPMTEQAPRIAVYPAAQFASLNPEAAKRIESLRQLLKEKPEPVPAPVPEPVPGPAAGASPALPFLPLTNAAQQMHVQVQYLTFQGGQGVRYLTQYAQGPIPINNRELFYTFQGLTDDGKYYVAVILPVSHSLLPTDADSMPRPERDAMSADFMKYMQNVTKTLGEQGAAGFKPALSDLDGLVESITVKP
jgi:hypothetical protein